LGVPDECPAAADLGQHRDRDLARVRAGGLVVTGLRAELDGATGQDLRDRSERRERRAHDHLDAARALEPVTDGAGERARLDERAVHLPVADDEWGTHQASGNASTPGSLRPSRNPGNPPPPAATGATAPPPPTAEPTGRRAPARAGATVPAANGGFSNTPIGPFHTTVRAVLRVLANRSAVRGPMSSPICPSGISRTPTVRP